MNSIKKFFKALLSKKSCNSCAHWIFDYKTRTNFCRYADDGETHCKECEKDPYSKWKEKKD